jgi:hypothetical protein
MPRDNAGEAVVVLFNIEKDPDGYPKSRDREALPCRPVNAECSICVVAAVPFYVKSVACCDVVATRTDSLGNLEFAGVVERGGYSVYRVWLRDPNLGPALTRALVEMGAVVEQDGSLIALGVSPGVDDRAILEYLIEGRQRDAWGLQDGYISEVSSESDDG